MMDPHIQLDKIGNIIKEKCLYCHKKLPDVSQATLCNSKKIGELVAPIGKLDVRCYRCYRCYRCHYKQTQLHPINTNHLKNHHSES